MSTTTPSSPHLPSIESNHLGSSLSPIQSESKTPERKPNATRFVPDPSHPTLIALGSSILQRLQDRAQEYDGAVYDQYIVRDFEHYRVFVDINAFMKHVLHVPENWKELWGPIIGRIKRDKVFLAALWDYSRRCGTQETQEQRFYKPLVDMGNVVLDFSKSSPDGAVKPQTLQRHLIDGPQRVLCGAMNNLPPDIVAVRDGFLLHILSGEDEEWHLEDTNITQARPFQMQEAEPQSDALVDGSYMPRLKVDGRDPQRGHAHPYTPSRFSKRGLTFPTTGLPTNGTISAPDLILSRKRRQPADESLKFSRKIQKVYHWSTPGGSSGQAAERRPRKPRANETDRQQDAYLQVGRYLLEQFSAPAFRSHATIGLVDRDRIQFYHANRSVILVSSAINFSASDRTGGLDKFIAIVIAFNRLSLRDNGILHNPHNCKPFQGDGSIATSRLAHGMVRMQEGNKLEFGGDEKTGPFTLTYGKIISHEPSLAGRSTAVLHAKSSKWDDVDLVVKVGWPSSGRIPESEFLKKAIEVAESTPGGKWAVNHLPRVLFTQDVVFDLDSTQEKVTSLFDDAEFADEEYKYERRTLRIIIQERLYPLTTLTNVTHIGQALVDVACIHRWLYEHVGILHRDLSLNNIMCRIIKEMNSAGVREVKEVYGVLTDYDLSSWTASLTSDYAKTSQQRTGTPPFIAHGLLGGTDTLHLYRHDVESLFYIILILATHYEIEAPGEGKVGGVQMRQGFKELPYQAWFDKPSYKALAYSKLGFFSNFHHFNLSSAFEDFRDWLEDIYLSFRRGIRSKDIHEDDLMSLRWRRDRASEDKVIPEFDDETLAGHVHYSALVDPVGNLEGELKGLIVRYPPPLPPTSTGAANADA